MSTHEQRIIDAFEYPNIRSHELFLINFESILSSPSSSPSHSSSASPSSSPSASSSSSPSSSPSASSSSSPSSSPSAS